MEYLDAPLSQLAFGIIHIENMVRLWCDSLNLVFTGHVIHNILKLFYHVNFYLATLALAQLHTQLIVYFSFVDFSSLYFPYHLLS